MKQRLPSIGSPPGPAELLAPEERRPSVARGARGEAVAFAPAHEALVRSEAARLGRRLPSRIEHQELVQAGFIGLLEGLGRAQAARSAAETTAFLRQRVRGAMLDALRAIDPLPTRTRRFVSRLQRYSTRHFATFGVAPTIPELQAGVARSERERKRVAQLATGPLGNGEILSIDALQVGGGGRGGTDRAEQVGAAIGGGSRGGRGGDGSGCGGGDPLAGARPPSRALEARPYGVGPLDRAARDELLAWAMANLTNDERLVLVLSYAEGLPLSVIAEAMERPRTTVHEIKCRARKRVLDRVAGMMG